MRDIELMQASHRPPMGTSEDWLAINEVVAKSAAFAHVIESAEDAVQAASALGCAEYVSFDVETVCRMYTEHFDVISCAVSMGMHTYVWPWDAMADDATRAPLDALLHAKTPGKTGHNIKYDLSAMRDRYECHVRGVVGDTMVMAKLLDSEGPGALADLSRLVGLPDYKNSMALEIQSGLRLISGGGFLPGVASHEGLPPRILRLLDIGINAEEFKYGIPPEDTISRYNALDALATWRLHGLLLYWLASVPDLMSTWTCLALPAIGAVADIERWGMAIDAEAVRSADSAFAMAAQHAKGRLDSACPGVNWSSPDQVASVLYDRIGLEPKKATAGGKRSVDSEVLEALSEEGHTVPRLLSAYRDADRMRTHYGTGLLGHVGMDGRVHPDIRICGTRSGRMSVTNPPLQTLPRAETEAGRRVRDYFIARNGFTFVEGDFSQLELRVAAMVSGDQVMRDIFVSGVDFHMHVAKLVSQIAWGIDPGSVTKKERSLAKAVVFGTIYGKQASTFAREWRVTEAAAKHVVNAILSPFCRLRQWMEESLHSARKEGGVWSEWAGRRARWQPLPNILKRGRAGATARNGAVNRPIQGGASDFFTASLVEVVRWIVRDGIEDDVRVVLPIHDAIMLEVREDMVSEVIDTVRGIMLGWPSCGVPMAVDFKVGPRWGSMKEVR